MTRGKWLSGCALVLLSACGGGGPGPGPGPQPGDLTVSYFQNGPAAGALLVTVSGGIVQSAAGLNGVQVSWAAPVPGTTKVLLSGPLHTGDLFTIHVADVALSTSYSVRVDQAADDVTFALVDPSSYSLTVHR
jgi:hypothetical protein